MDLHISKNIRPFVRQFYRGNGFLFLLAMMQTLLMTAGQLMISWLLQQIIVLKNGSVAEQGSFDDLMAQKEYFYSLFTVSQ